MSYNPQAALAHYVAQHPEVTQYCVAFSGGMDSHVLLYIAAELLAATDGIALRAVHVNHGLSPDSARWAEHSENVCASLDIALTVCPVDVVDSGEGPEANARMARYGAFASQLLVDEHLLLAQHLDDQAETFLLQALRGSGPDGLASIPRKRTFAQGIMARPLLGCSRESLSEFATSAALEWIEDPSNQDTRFDRNFLRHEILPLMKSRWPSAAKTLNRSAMRCAAASQTLLVLAQEDLDMVRMRGSAEISVSELRSLPRERAYNVLRIWVRQAGLRMPRLQDLAHVLSDLIRAREDSAGIVNVRDYEFRRHRDRLFLLAPQTETEPFHYEWPAPFEPLNITEIGLELSSEACRAQGIVLPPAGTVIVKNRTGGELIKLGEPAFHKAVKKLLQESAIPPWQRANIPLLYIDGRLAAVWNIAVAVDFRTGGSIEAMADAELV
ncbi:MAG: tRNA lysidine(34) synthetase TilS [Granulosicoccus sp.]